jgi:imidazole glycerol-phosphate synthase subunit HisH
MLGVIDYGVGNHASVQNALDYLRIPHRLVSQPGDFATFDRLILPGVGAFGEAMDKIISRGFRDELQEFALVRQRPVLGICLGMQLLLESSVEHGFSTGLGIVRGKVNFLGDQIKDLPIPHIGWNDVCALKASRLLEGIEEPNRTFYFVHSYYCQLAERGVVTGRSSHGFEFDVMFEADNVCGVQFHPEKSQKSGLTLLKNFWEM